MDPRRRWGDTTTYVYIFTITDNSRKASLHKENIIHISGTKKDFESYEGFPLDEYDESSKIRDENERRMTRFNVIGNWLAERILIYINTYCAKS